MARISLVVICYMTKQIHLEIISITTKIVFIKWQAVLKVDLTTNVDHQKQNKAKIKYRLETGKFALHFINCKTVNLQLMEK